MALVKPGDTVWVEDLDDEPLAALLVAYEPDQPTVASIRLEGKSDRTYKVSTKSIRRRSTTPNTSTSSLSALDGQPSIVLNTATSHTNDEAPDVADTLVHGAGLPEVVLAAETHLATGGTIMRAGAMTLVLPAMKHVPSNIPGTQQDEPPRMPRYGSIARAVLGAGAFAQQDQVVMAHGRPGSGKSMALQHTLLQVAQQAGATLGELARIQQALLLLNALTTAATAPSPAATPCPASTRACLRLRLHLGPASRPRGFSVAVDLLEASRLSQLRPGQRTFNILHHLCGGAPQELRRSLRLFNPSYPLLSRAPRVPNAPPDGPTFTALAAALDALSVPKDLQRHFWGCLAAVVLLTSLTFTEQRGRGAAPASASATALASAAELLGLEETALMGLLSDSTVAASKKKRDAVVADLYCEVVRWAVDQVNAALGPEAAAAKAAAAAAAAGAAAGGVAKQGGWSVSGGEKSENGGEKKSDGRGWRVELVDVGGVQEQQEGAGLDQLLLAYVADAAAEAAVADCFCTPRSNGRAEELPVPNVHRTDMTRELVEFLESMDTGVLPLLVEFSTGSMTGGSSGAFREMVKSHPTRRAVAEFPTYPEDAMIVRHGAAKVEYSLAACLQDNQSAVPKDMLRVLATSTNPIVTDAAAHLDSQLVIDECALAISASRAGPPRIRRPRAQSALDLMDEIRGTAGATALSPDSLVAPATHHLLCLPSPTAPDQACLKQLKAFSVEQTVQMSAAGLAVRLPTELCADRWAKIKTESIAEEPLSPPMGGAAAGGAGASPFANYASRAYSFSTNADAMEATRALLTHAGIPAHCYHLRGPQVYLSASAALTLTTLWSHAAPSAIPSLASYDRSVVALARRTSSRVTTPTKPLPEGLWGPTAPSPAAGPIQLPSPFAPPASPRVSASAGQSPRSPLSGGGVGQSPRSPGGSGRLEGFGGSGEGSGTLPVVQEEEGGAGGDAGASGADGWVEGRGDGGARGGSGAGSSQQDSNGDRAAGAEGSVDRTGGSLGGTGSVTAATVLAFAKQAAERKAGGTEGQEAAGGVSGEAHGYGEDDGDYISGGGLMTEADILPRGAKAYARPARGAGKGAGTGGGAAAGVTAAAVAAGGAAALAGVAVAGAASAPAARETARWELSTPSTSSSTTSTSSTSTPLLPPPAHRRTRSDSTTLDDPLTAFAPHPHPGPPISSSDSSDDDAASTCSDSSSDSGTDPPSRPPATYARCNSSANPTDAVPHLPSINEESEISIPTTPFNPFTDSSDSDEEEANLPSSSHPPSHPPTTTSPPTSSTRPTATARDAPPTSTAPPSAPAPLPPSHPISAPLQPHAAPADGTPAHPSTVPPPAMPSMPSNVTTYHGSFPEAPPPIASESPTTTSTPPTTPLAPSPYLHQDLQSKPALLAAFAAHNAAPPHPPQPPVSAPLPVPQSARQSYPQGSTHTPQFLSVTPLRDSLPNLPLSAHSNSSSHSTHSNPPLSTHSNPPPPYPGGVFSATSAAAAFLPVSSRPFPPPAPPIWASSDALNYGHASEEIQPCSPLPSTSHLAAPPSPHSSRLQPSLAPPVDFSRPARPHDLLGPPAATPTPLTANDHQTSHPPPSLPPFQSHPPPEQRPTTAPPASSRPLHTAPTAAPSARPATAAPYPPATSQPNGLHPHPNPHPQLSPRPGPSTSVPNASSSGAPPAAPPGQGPSKNQAFSERIDNLQVEIAEAHHTLDLEIRQITEIAEGKRGAPPGVAPSRLLSDFLDDYKQRMADVKDKLKACRKEVAGAKRELGSHLGSMLADLSRVESAHKQWKAAFKARLGQAQKHVSEFERGSRPSARYMNLATSLLPHHRRRASS